MSTKYVLVEITDERGEALRIIRRAIHRAAQDHHVECKDVPIHSSCPILWARTRAIMEAVWQRVTQRGSADFSQVERRGHFGSPGHFGGH